MIRHRKVVIKVAILALVGMMGIALVSALIAFKRNDDRIIANFVVAYKKFDGALAVDEQGALARAALVELSSRAAAFSRLSSATKYDRELRALAPEIADFSKKELNTDRSSKEFGALNASRITSYMRFQELTGAP